MNRHTTFFLTAVVMMLQGNSALSQSMGAGMGMGMGAAPTGTRDNPSASLCNRDIKSTWDAIITALRNGREPTTAACRTTAESSSSRYAAATE